MRTTASEARAKLCHCTLVNDTFETCEGPRCMAWRWNKAPTNKRRIHHLDIKALTQPERPDDVPGTWLFFPYDPIEEAYAHWLEPDEDCDDRRTGYCGLAGVIL